MPSVARPRIWTVAVSLPVAPGPNDIQHRPWEASIDQPQALSTVPGAEGLPVSRKPAAEPAGHLPATSHQPTGAGTPGLSPAWITRGTRCGRPTSPTCPWPGDSTGRNMDWHSRYVVAWRLSNTLETGFCAEALGDALNRPDVFNTDQGSQFTSREFTQILQDHSDQHGRQGQVPGQHPHGAAMADGEVRGGLPEGLR